MISNRSEHALKLFTLDLTKPYHLPYYLIEFVQNNSLETSIIDFFTEAGKVVSHYIGTQAGLELCSIISEGEGIIADVNTGDVALSTGSILKYKLLEYEYNKKILGFKDESR